MAMRRGKSAQMYYSALDICQQFLKNVKQTNNNDDGGAQFLASCPCATNHKNGDIHKSLSVGDGRAKTLLHCQTGCALDDILEAIGVTKCDLYPDKAGATAHKSGRQKPSQAAAAKDVPSKPKVRSTLVAKYIWPVLGGADVIQEKRIDSDGNKEFLWRRSSGAYGLPKGTKLHLYNAEIVSIAAEQGRNIYLVEGAKDAETLIKIGACATTTGSSSSNFEPHHCELLRDATVIALYDNDLPGMKYCKRAVNTLRAYAAELSVVHLDGLRRGGDITNWFENHDADEFREYVFRAKELGYKETFYELDRRILAAEIEIAEAKRAEESTIDFSGLCAALLHFGSGAPSVNQAAIYQAILGRADNGVATIGRSEIENVTGLSRTVVSDGISWLVKNGRIERVKLGQKGHGFSSYIVI